jgi:UDP-glucose 4-epimerase
MFSSILECAVQSADQSKSYIVNGLYNIGSGNAIDRLQLIQIIEKHIVSKATLNLLPMQPGDIKEAIADITTYLTNMAMCRRQE